MGNANNIRIRKPHGAKALAAQHDRCRPKGSGSKILSFSTSSDKLSTKKLKTKKRVKIGSST